MAFWASRLATEGRRVSPQACRIWRLGGGETVVRPGTIPTPPISVSAVPRRPFQSIPFGRGRCPPLFCIPVATVLCSLLHVCRARLAQIIVSRGTLPAASVPAPPTRLFICAVRPPSGPSGRGQAGAFSQFRLVTCPADFLLDFRSSCDYLSMLAIVPRGSALAAAMRLWDRGRPDPLMSATGFREMSP